MSEVRQPTIFLPHGGGPCFWMEFPPPFGPHAWDGLRAYLAGIVESLPERPKAFVVVTAHWEEAKPTVSTAAAPGMLFDYYGFPAHTYQLSYPAPGEPERRRRGQAIAGGGGPSRRRERHARLRPRRLRAVPDRRSEGRDPVVMLSIQRDLDPARHIAIGKALAPLRDQGIVIVGSGMSFHDLRHFFDGDGRASAAFDAWLDETTTKTDPKAREERLIRWKEAPCARACHPREEHLIPLMVVAGAAGDSAGTHSFRDTVGGKVISGFRFG